MFRSPYLLGISAYVLILTVISTFIYFTRLQMVAALGTDLDMRTGVFARIDIYTQLGDARAAGGRDRAPDEATRGSHNAGAAAGDVALGFMGLAISALAGRADSLQATFSAVQRSIIRPARETLFTVVPRDDKYKSKAFIDTFVYRGGDVVGAQVEGLLGRLGMGLAALVALTVPLAIVWGALALWLGRAQHRRITRDATPARVAPREEAVAL